MVKAHSLFTDYDLELFAAGFHTRLYEKFGSHTLMVDGEEGTYFAVYAPAASSVEVIGDFNHWQGHDHRLNVRWDGSGVWEGFIPGVAKGTLYKYRLHSHQDDVVREKADPYARLYEMPPKTASIVWNDEYQWEDQEWLIHRSENNDLNKPMTVYEVHLGSWKKNSDGSRSLHYDELAVELVTYVKEMNFTHVEFMPVMEHPFYPSWGYLCTGYFAPSSRYGNTELFKLLVDRLHQAGIGVILDWVPAHFPSDVHALADFDGSALYEHPDRGKGFHPDWNSLIFNFERPQIRSFLLSSARFWLDQYHTDGLRVDAVASMLYLDYSREEGEWSPNMYGGNEYLAAAEFLRTLNKSMYHDFPDIHMIAEESTAFPGVTRPVDMNGLGFGLKWMMGWMNDGLEYFSKDPIHRKYHHHEISRSLTYAFTENYILPLSHDEVVHGKGSLFEKMPGDDWKKIANLRLLYLSMYTHPGQKLLFMGCEFGQTSEWNVNYSLHWELLNSSLHSGLKTFVSELNHIYKNEESLYRLNYTPEGYEWIDYSDSENTVLCLMRKSQKEYVVVVLNFAPVVRENYRIGVPEHTEYVEIMNSDRIEYGGSNVLNSGELMADEMESHGRPYSLNLTLPPLAGIILKSK
ncbi:MAG: 1,4-alpha-glucan branching protein GlgB [Saprospiraceae bacterium]|nr:1,4-alpha-glucan branching protein GlgB [Saprospiraceae bacterium]